MAGEIPQLSITTPASGSPISLGDAKRHLGVTDDAHDLDIEALIRAAANYLGRRVGRTWLTTEYLYKRSSWPAEGFIELPLPPIATVDSVKYYDPANVQQVVTAYKLWQTFDVPSRIYPDPSSYCWPTLKDRIDAIQIEYTAGYGDPADVPEEAKQAIRLLVRHWYDSPSPIVVGTISKELELTLSSLCYSLGTGVYADF